MFHWLAERHPYALGTMPYTIVSDIPGFPTQQSEIMIENVLPAKMRETDFKLGDQTFNPDNHNGS